MNTKHTPAPWLIDMDGTPMVYALNESGTNRFSASIVKGYANQRREFSFKTSTEEIQANAHLIAAAPKMLEALERIANHGHADDCNLLNYANGRCDCGIDDAFKVIALAKGEQP